MRISPQLKDHVIALRAAGASYGQVAEATALPRDTVKTICRRTGTTPRHQTDAVMSAMRHRYSTGAARTEVLQPGLPTQVVACPPRAAHPLRHLHLHLHRLRDIVCRLRQRWPDLLQSPLLHPFPVRHQRRTTHLTGLTGCRFLAFY